MTEVDDRTLQELVQRARIASKRAYAPYSKFPVGAALLTASGKIFDGCNVENASYGLTVCAERNAIFKMVADGEREVVALAVFTPTAEPSAPCGACRQVISEFGKTTSILCACDGDTTLKRSIEQLLPDSFGNKNLT